MLFIFVWPVVLAHFGFVMSLISRLASAHNAKASPMLQIQAPQRVCPVALDFKQILVKQCA
jgi:hypothetical protein